MEALAQQRLDAADLGGAGKKHQERSGLRAQRPHRRVGDLPLDRRPRIAPEIAGLDRKGAAGALDHRRVVEKLTHARAIERRRHHQELELGAQALLHVARERQAEVGIERALVEFIEYDGGDVGERGILENEAGEHAFGHHFGARGGGDFGAETHAVADACADGFVKRRGHARGRGPRRQPARLEHDELFPRRPRFRRQHERYPRGLAGARRRDQHRRMCRAQRSGQFRQRRIDGKRLGGGAHRATLHARCAGGKPRRRAVHSAAEAVAKSCFKC